MYRTTFLPRRPLPVLALSALLASAAPPAQAQAPNSGSWNAPVSSDSGQMSFDYWYQGQHFSQTESPWSAWGWYGPGDMVSAGSDIGKASSVTTNGSLTVTRTWQGPGSPPPHSYILESASAQGSGGVNGFGTADDGLGDAAVSTGTGTGETSSGGHLVQVDSSSGTITRSVTISASGDTPASSGYQGESVATGNFGWTFDTRAVTLTRKGARAVPKTVLPNGETVGEWVDPDGTAHGDTTFSTYTNETVQNGDGSTSTIQALNPNWQTFIPQFAGNWSSLLNYSWKPSESDDTQTSGLWQIPTDPGMGTAITLPITYTVTGPADGAKATATYDLTIHEPYDDVRRVDSSGNPLGESAPGDPAGLLQLGSADADVPLSYPAVPVQYPNQNVSWTVASLVGGGLLSGTSIVLTTVADPPVGLIAILGIAGLSLQTESAYAPPDPTIFNAPDQMNASFLQQAYQNYVNNQTALPGQQVTNNLVDDAFGQYIGNTPSLSFQSYFGPYAQQTSVTTTVSWQMLNYYTDSDEYDEAGLVTTTAPGTVTRPGNLVWTYLWHFAGA